MRASRRERGGVRRVAILLAVALLGGVLYVVASGRWQAIYIFLVQFHQRSLWSTFVALSIPLLVLALIRGWGVEDVPYEEEAVELGPGRLRRIVRRIAGARRNVYLQALLVDELSEAASEVIAINEGLDLAKVRKLCRSGAWTRDRDLATLIRDRQLPGEDEIPFTHRFERVLGAVERALRGGIR